MNPLSPCAAMVALERVRHPADGSEVSIFDSWSSACVHLQRHVLTAPECHAWAVVVPEMADLFDPDDARGRWSLAQRTLEFDGGPIVTIYGLFCRTVRAASADAVRLGWSVTAEGVTVALGTDGLLMVFASPPKRTVLETAFFPGQGDPASVVSAAGWAEPRPDSHSPRTGGMRSGRRGSKAGPGRDQAMHERQTGWSSSQKLYYGVFRPAVQFIRSQYHRGLDARGRRRLNDYGLLKDVLPRMSQLKYDTWLNLRDPAHRS